MSSYTPPAGNAVHLVFSQDPQAPGAVHLVFGDDTGGAIPAVSVTLTATLPKPTLAGMLVETRLVELGAMLPAVTLNATMTYASETQRPMVAAARSDWQHADSAQSVVSDSAKSGQRHRGVQSATWQGARPEHDNTVIPSNNGVARVRRSAAPNWLAGAPLRADARTALWQNADRSSRRQVSDSAMQAAPLRAMSADSAWQNTIRTSRAHRRTNWAGKAQNRPVRLETSMGAGVARSLHRQAPYQPAMRPPAGLPVNVVVPPVFDPCYLPPAGDAAHLLFSKLPSGAELFFICERHGNGGSLPATTVVPARKVYMVLNSALLTRVDTGAEVRASSLSLSIDVDSWTWGFSASVDLAAASLLQPDSEELVELEATINGVPYRLMCESMQRQRQFGSATLSISGRGKALLLDTPHSRIVTLANSTARTAQQLMADVLTENGVPMGWGVDFGLTDWLVPANAWSFQGSRIAAINQIAQAAGGYVQPHATANTLRVLHRYPVAPWEWAASVTPDFELPAELTTQEGISWSNKADYNRVFVSGENTGGVLGQITRAGSAGDKVAEMVVDSLMTHADAVRQRGRAVLSDTGRQALVSLRLPVLPATGIITPGKFVRYVDGGTTRLGIVRSTNVDVGLPEIWQSLSVETHL